MAAIAARVRGHVPSSADGDAFAPGDRRAAAALDASGARVYDRDRLGSHGTLSRRGDSWWFFDTHPDFVRETLARDGSVMRCPHLVGKRPTRAPHAIVTERRANDVFSARGGFLGIVSKDVKDPTERPSLRRVAHCCECWERLEFKRLRAAVMCHACGEAFPKSKTEPFSLLCDPKIATSLKRDSSAAATARAAIVVDVCFLCARDWKETRKNEEDKQNQLSQLASRHACYDAASRAFAELPLAKRVEALESRVRKRVKVGAEKNAPSSPERSGPVVVAGTTSTGYEAVVSDDTALISAEDLALAASSLTADLRRRMEAVDLRRRAADAADASPGPRSRAPALVGGSDDDKDAPFGATNDDDSDDSDSAIRQILEALRVRGDDVDAAMRDTRDARGEDVAEAFLKKTVGDEEDASERAAKRDRARLDEVMRRDGGAYPLKRSVRFSSESKSVQSEKPTDVTDVGETGADEGSDKRASSRPSEKDTILPDFYDTARQREAALLEKAKNRDAVSFAVASEEETTRLAEEARESDLKAAEEAKRRKRTIEQEKLEKWATRGVDLAEYKFVGGVHGVAASVATDGEDKGDKGDETKEEEDDARDAGDEKKRPALDRASSPDAPTDAAGTKNVDDFPSTAKTGDGLLTNSRSGGIGSAEASGVSVSDLPHSVVRSMAARAASITRTVVSPIIETVLQRVFQMAREPKNEPTAARTDARSSSSFGDEKKNSSNAPARTKQKHRRRAAPSVDVLAVADSGHALPAHPRAPPGSGFAAAWTGAAARRRGRLRNVKRRESFDEAFVHNATHGRAHEPFDETDAPGVPIPLRETLRVAAELPSALSPLGSPGSDDPERLLRRAERSAAGGAFSHEALSLANDAEVSVLVHSLHVKPSNGNEHVEHDASGAETETAAYARARARREENTKREHAKLRGVALGIAEDDCSNAARDAALSFGRVIAPLARLTDARFPGGGEGQGEDSVSGFSPGATPSGSPGVGGAVAFPESTDARAEKRTRRLSASTASALVAEAASRAKAAVADALGVNLAERKARVFGLGLPVSSELENALMSESERDAELLSRTRKRQKAIRAREAIRARGKALVFSETDADDASDAFVEGRGVCAVDVATRARVRTPGGANAGVLLGDDADGDDAVSSSKNKNSRTFLEKERAYHRETFGRGSEPPQTPSALVLAARRGALGGFGLGAHTLIEAEAEADGSASAAFRAPMPDDAFSASAAQAKDEQGKHELNEKEKEKSGFLNAGGSSLRRVVSASAFDAEEVFLDLEDAPLNRATAAADPSATTLASAAAKLRALAEAHKLKLDSERPFPERHLRAEESSPEDSRWRGADATTDAENLSDDSDAAYQRLATPFDSDGVPTPTLLDLDDSTNHFGPATPESEPPTDSSDEEEDDWVNVAYTNRFVDKSGRSLRLYEDDPGDVSSGGEDANGSGPDESESKALSSNGLDVSAARSVGRESSSNGDGAATSDARSRVADDVRSVGASPEGSETSASSSPDDQKKPARRSVEDDYEARVARVAAVADRVSEAARLETRAALARLGRGARTIPSVDKPASALTKSDGRLFRESSARDASSAGFNEKTERRKKTKNEDGFFVSVSFFFPSVPYADVATPHARGRVERFVGSEIKRAIVAAVTEKSTTFRITEEDVEVVGMSRGPPPAVLAATAADAASGRMTRGVRSEKENTTTSDEEQARVRFIDSERDKKRARALAVHCAVRVPDGAAFGTDAATSLGRLKNARARRAPESNRRLMLREPRDDEDARFNRRAGAKARWDRLRQTGVALTNVSSRPVRGVGLAEVAVTGSGAFRDLPPPPSPPPLVDLFGGDEAAAEAFLEEKFRRDVRDAEDDIEFPDDDENERDAFHFLASGEEQPGSREGPEKRDDFEKKWSYDPLDAMFTKPPLAMDEVPPHERVLTRSPLERLAVVADAHARRLAPETRQRSAADVERDAKRVLDEIRDAHADPASVRERQKADAEARVAGLASRRAKANRARHDGGIDHVDVFENVENVAPRTAEVSRSERRPSAERRRRLSPTRFAVARTDDDDAYVNPRLLRLAARGRGEAAFRTPGEPYLNPRLERLKAGRSREAVNAEGDRTPS